MNTEMLAASPNLATTLPPSPWKKIISFPVALAALLVAAAFVPLRDFVVDPDVWWHLKVGATLLSTHHWPTVDPYSFTAHGSPWIAYEWLGEVMLAAVQHAWGIRGLLALEIGLSADNPHRSIRSRHASQREFESGVRGLRRDFAAGLPLL